VQGLTRVQFLNIFMFCLSSHRWSVLCLACIPYLSAGIGVLKQGLAPTIETKWVSFTWRRRHNSFSETLFWNINEAEFWIKTGWWIISRNIISVSKHCRIHIVTLGRGSSANKMRVKANKRRIHIVYVQECTARVINSASCWRRFRSHGVTRRHHSSPR
jgi:hypothetical protein